jgi:hypothetical protein
MCYIIIKLRDIKALSNYYLKRGMGIMGTIVCQACNSTIDHFEDEKVTVLYSKCDDGCAHDHKVEDLD